MTLHPQARLLLLVVLAVLLPQYSLSALLAALLFTVAACWANQTVGHWLTATIRLKWLFFSILVLYGWFTPGLPVFDVAAVNMPTREGLSQALFRVLLLAALVAAVMWLVKPLSANVLSQALSRLLRPLQLIGIDVDRLSKRLAMTLAAVSGIQSLLSQRKDSGWLAAAGAAIVSIESGDLHAEAQDQSPPQLASVAPRDGFVVILLLMVFGAPLLLRAVG